MQTRTTIAIALTGLVSVALAIIGVVGDGTVTLSDLRSVGVGGAIGTVVWYFMSRQRRDDEAIYEAGHRAGYDSGFLDGRRTAKPVLVPMLRVSNDN